MSSFHLAQSELPPAILNHSIRVFLYANFLASHEGSVWAADDKFDLLFVACILHDIGATDRFNGHERFEVEGADVVSTRRFRSYPAVADYQTPQFNTEGDLEAHTGKHAY